MDLSYSLEDYIETIYIQVLKNGAAKVTEISKVLGVRKASVTGALNALAEKKLVNYVPYAPITLTKEGKKTAEKIFEKHKTILEFFVNILGVSEQEALETSCRMEHIISRKIFKNMGILNQFMKEQTEESLKFKAQILRLFS
ncbi:MAG: metal-dependent transcriptional regulator [Heliobacteriaceae bacterium]|jgi:DtxR family Mn-dependent transcriptional regulator|nr:metal-dependent transcriptional regulator [Heliobacteriaceae bacterium]